MGHNEPSEIVAPSTTLGIDLLMSACQNYVDQDGLLWCMLKRALQNDFLRNRTKKQVILYQRDRIRDSVSMCIPFYNKYHGQRKILIVNLGCLTYLVVESKCYCEKSEQEDCCRNDYK